MSSYQTFRVGSDIPRDWRDRLDARVSNLGLSISKYILQLIKDDLNDEQLNSRDLECAGRS